MVYSPASPSQGNPHRLQKAFPSSLRNSNYEETSYYGSFPCPYKWGYFWRCPQTNSPKYIVSNHKYLLSMLPQSSEMWFNKHPLNEYSPLDGGYFPFRLTVLLRCWWTLVFLPTSFLFLPKQAHPGVRNLLVLTSAWPSIRSVFLLKSLSSAISSCTKSGLTGT